MNTRVSPQKTCIPGDHPAYRFFHIAIHSDQSQYGVSICMIIRLHSHVASKDLRIETAHRGILRKDDLRFCKLGQRVIHGHHPIFNVCLQNGIDLVVLSLADEVPYGVVCDEHLHCRNQHLAVGGLHELLADNALNDGGQLRTNLLLLLIRECVDDPVYGLGRCRCVQCR